MPKIIPELDPSEAIADSIIEQARLSSMPEADKKFIKENLVLQISRRLGIVIMENLSAEGVAEYSKLVKDSPLPDPESLRVFLEKYVPDYPSKIKEGLDEFIKEAVKSLTK